MERIAQQLTLIRTSAIALVLVVAVFGVPMVGAQLSDTKGDTPQRSETVKETTTKETTTTQSGGGTSSTPASNCAADIGQYIVDANGDPFNRIANGTKISVMTWPTGGQAQITIKNISSDCTYQLNLAAYRVYAPFGTPEYISTQQLHQSQTMSVAPNSVETFWVALPQCRFQVDLFAGPNVPQTNPDFGAPPLSNTHTLFDWTADHLGVVCDDTPPECPVPAPAIYTQGSASGVVGQYFEHEITIIGAVYPAGVMPEGVLPAGLSFERVSGTHYRIFGVPTAPGVSQFSISASNQCGFVTVPITITITGGACPIPPPIITSPTTASGTVGVPFTYTITTAGGPSAVSVTNLPSWLSFNAATNTLSGTPTLAGVYTAILRAENECGIASIPLVITIAGGDCPIPPPVITSPTTATGTVGVPFTYTIEFTGIGRVNATDLPDWLSLSRDGKTLSGTPTHPGIYTAVISVGNSCGVSEIILTITVGSGQCPIDPPFITSPTTASGSVGQAFSYQVAFVGKAEISTGPLPTWLTFNASTNTLSGTPTQPGSHTIIITATNECGTATINLVITIRGGGGTCPIPPPFITSATTATATVGKAFTYTITTSGGPVEDYKLGQAPSWLTLSGNKLSGTPTQTGKHTVILTASNECGTATINLVITVEGGGGGGGGNPPSGGGPRRPSVVLFSEPEILGASISLAQLPYTGVGTSILQLALFILGLLAISGGIIYMIMRRFSGVVVREVQFSAPAVADVSAGVLTKAEASAPEMHQGDETPGDVYEEYFNSMPAAAPVVASVARDAHYTHETASVAPHSEPASVVAAMSAPRNEHRAVAPAPRANTERALEQNNEISIARIQTEARSARALISDDGAELIAKSAEGEESKALERMQQIVDIAKTRYPREDGWLILDKDRVRETLFISTLSMVPLFVEWIVRCEDKKVFTFLRMLKHQEQPVADFMRKVVSELDSAHRARMEGIEAQAKANAHVAEVTYHLSNKDFESLVNELLHGVDERYDSAYTSVRLALVRALDMLKERSLRTAGAPYGAQVAQSH